MKALQHRKNLVFCRLHDLHPAKRVNNMITFLCPSDFSLFCPRSHSDFFDVGQDGFFAQDVGGIFHPLLFLEHFIRYVVIVLLLLLLYLSMVFVPFHISWHFLIELMTFVHSHTVVSNRPPCYFAHKVQQPFHADKSKTKSASAAASVLPACPFFAIPLKSAKTQTANLCNALAAAPVCVYAALAACWWQAAAAANAQIRLLLQAGVTNLLLQGSLICSCRGHYAIAGVTNLPPGNCSRAICPLTADRTPTQHTEHIYIWIRMKKGKDFKIMLSCF